MFPGRMVHWLDSAIGQSYGLGCAIAPGQFRFQAVLLEQEHVHLGLLCLAVKQDFRVDFTIR